VFKINRAMYFLPHNFEIMTWTSSFFGKEEEKLIGLIFKPYSHENKKPDIRNKTGSINQN